jgi:peptide/nickel transport system substrate-binding protein
MLETGEVDLVANILPHHVKGLERNKHIKVKRASDTPSLYGLASYPDNYPIFKESNFDQAFTHAINRQEIVNKIYLGEGYPLYMYASKSELGYDPTVVEEFNPDRARELIKQSSYKRGTPIILSYASDVPNGHLVAATIQKYMADVGVTIKLQKLEAGVAATYTRTRDPKLGHTSLYSFSGGRDPSTRLILSLPSTSIYCSWATRANQALLDDLVMKQARETDQDMRLVILKQIHATLRKEPGGPVLFGLNQIYAMTDRIEYTWLPKEAFLFALGRIKIVK